MSYQPRAPGRSPSPRDQYGQPRPVQSGSVRAARERLVAAQAQLREQQMSPSSRERNPLTSQYSIMRSPEPSQLPPTTYGQPYVPRQPSPQSPQWPLARNQSPTHNLRGPSPINSLREFPNPAAQSHPWHGPHQNPIGSIPEQVNPPPTNRLPSLPKAPEPRQNPYADAPPSPPFANSRPLTTSSDATESSLGTIPDFPVAVNSQPRSRPQNNGFNPPQPRGVTSSHYSQYSNVSPIQEENGGDSSHRSYASSAVIPPQVGTDFYFDDTPSDEEGPRAGAANRYRSDAAAALVRQASLGKRVGRPAMTSIKAPTGNSPPRENELRMRADSDDSQRQLVPPVPPVPMPTHDQQDDTRVDSQTYSEELDDYLAELEKSSSDPSTLRQPSRSMLSDRVGQRRPPSLNVDGIRAAEARGSLTSLPDLIRRATRLAANLDRGKTASRLGMDWMLNQDPAPAQRPEQDRSAKPAGMVKLQSPAPSYSGTTWPANRSRNPLVQEEAPYDQRQKKERRCCGMSRNSFIGILFILTLLIAAAVIIPVALIVIPKMNATPSADTTCAKKLSCANGADAVMLSDGNCGCLCVNGFQGARCNLASDAGCGTVNIPNHQKATAGINIVPLLGTADKYSIPLNSTAVLLEFAKENMTCTTENALVSFPGLAKNIRSSGTAVRREAPAITTNGIVIAGQPTATATNPGAPAATVTVLPGAANNQPVTNSTAQQFAKIGILFLLQDSGVLNTAVTAQEKLDAYMKAAVAQGGAAPAAASNITLGSGYAINMWDWTVTLKNGTVYGAGWNGTVTSFKV